jgi:hypothetical protein
MTTTDRVAALMMMTVRAEDSTTTVRVSVVSMMMTGLANAVSMTTTVRAEDLTTTVRVATAVLTTVQDAVSTTKRSRAVAARATSGRKTRCMTVRKPLEKSA